MPLETPLILAIETATRAGSVAVVRGRELIESVSGNADESHSISLLEMIEDVLERSGAGLSDLDLFAAANGPGSFTGLRIGLATIKAFAICMNKKCAAVSTLAAIAHAAGNSEHTIALLPAGRGELFAQSFKVADFGVRALDEAAHLTPCAVLERYVDVRRATLAGEGAYAYAEVFDSSTRLWVLAPRSELAASVAHLAFDDYRRGELLGAEEIQASYVRPSDAESNEKWQQKSQPSVPA